MNPEDAQNKLSATERETLAALVVQTARVVGQTFNYGDDISMEWLEDQFGCDRDSTRFGFAIMGITPLLRKQGYRLSRKGTNGQGYRILLREEMGAFVVTQEVQKLAHTRSNNEMLIAVDTTGMTAEAINELQYATNLSAAIFESGKRLIELQELPARIVRQNPLQLTGNEDDAENPIDD